MSETEPVATMSPVNRGFVQIEAGGNGLSEVTVFHHLQAGSPADLVAIHMRCQRVEVSDGVRLVGPASKQRSVRPVEVYQSYPTKTVTIRLPEHGRPTEDPHHSE